MEQYYNFLEQIAGRTDISLIQFFLIMAGLVLPLYALIIKDRRRSRKHENEKRELENKKRALENERHDKYIEREKEIINVMREISAVIAENTSITATLKDILRDYRADTKQSVSRIHERIDDVFAVAAEIKTMLQVKNS